MQNVATVLRSNRCCGSVTCWYGSGFGSGSSDPYRISD
jgi:hypothetical protein